MASREVETFANMPCPNILNTSQALRVHWRLVRLRSQPAWRFGALAITAWRTPARFRLPSHLHRAARRWPSVFVSESRISEGCLVCPDVPNTVEAAHCAVGIERVAGVEGLTLVSRAT